MTDLPADLAAGIRSVASEVSRLPSGHVELRNGLYRRLVLIADEVASGGSGERLIHDGACPQPCPGCAAEHDEARANRYLDETLTENELVEKVAQAMLDDALEKSNHPDRGRVRVTDDAVGEGYLNAARVALAAIVASGGSGEAPAGLVVVSLTEGEARSLVLSRESNSERSSAYDKVWAALRGPVGGEAGQDGE